MEIKLFKHYETGNLLWGKPIERLETAFETQPNGDLHRVKVTVLHYLLYATESSPHSTYRGSMPQLAIDGYYKTITDPVLEALLEHTKPQNH